MRTALLALIVLLVSIGPIHADTIFGDDFEGILDQWIGVDGGSHSGIIVADPLNMSNHVLSFTGLAFGGDIFSVEVALVPGQVYALSFDYLGFPQPGSPPESFGGFVGIADETASLPLDVMKFLAGTCDEGNILIDLVDDGTWHSYSIVINPYSLITITDDAIRIVMEDWGGEVTASCPAGVVGDVFFDNICLEPAGPVATERTTWGGVKALYR